MNINGSYTKWINVWTHFVLEYFITEYLKGSMSYNRIALAIEIETGTLQSEFLTSKGVTPLPPKKVYFRCCHHTRKVFIFINLECFMPLM